MKGTIVEYNDPDGIIQVYGVRLPFKYDHFKCSVGQVIDVSLQTFPRHNKAIGVGFRVGEKSPDFFNPKPAYKLGMVSFFGENRDHGYVKELIEYKTKEHTQHNKRNRLSLLAQQFKYNSRLPDIAVKNVVCYRTEIIGDKKKAADLSPILRNAIYMGSQEQVSWFLVPLINNIIDVKSIKSNWEASLFSEADLRVKLSENHRHFYLVDIKESQSVFSSDIEKRLSIFIHLLTEEYKHDVFKIIVKEILKDGGEIFLFELLKKIIDSDQLQILEKHKTDILQAFVIDEESSLEEILSLLELDRSEVIRLMIASGRKKNHILKVCKANMALLTKSRGKCNTLLKSKFSTVELFNNGFNIKPTAVEYSKYLINQINDFLSNQNNLLLFDIEVKNDIIIEFGYLSSKEEKCIYRGEFKNEELFLAAINDIIKDHEVFIGHNILEFDIPILEKKLNIAIDRSKVYDTLIWEVALNPFRKSYALATDHTALVDAQNTDKVFRFQLLRLILLERDSRESFSPFLKALGLTAVLDIDVRNTDGVINSTLLNLSCTLSISYNFFIYLKC